MSKKQLQIYSLSDFDQADRLGKITMYMMEPERFALNDPDFQYYNQLLRAYQGCYKQLSQAKAIKWIQENIPGCESYYKSHRTYADMVEVYGHFVVKNKQLQRQIVAEKLYAIAKKLENDKQYEAAGNMYEKAAKMQGLDKISHGINPDDFKLPEITATADPAALQFEDIEHESIDDDE